MTGIRRRARVAAALNAVTRAVGPAAFTWIGLRFGASLGVVSEGRMAPSAAVLAAVVIFLAIGRAIFVRIPIAILAREVDRRADARGRVIAAFELGGSADPFARAAVDDAAPAVADAMARARMLFPWTRPAGLSSGLAMLGLAALAGATLDGIRWSHSAGASRSIAARSPVAATVSSPPSPALPTTPWVIREVRALLAPQAAPARPTPRPPAVALAPTPAPAPPRGSSIADPEKRAFFDRVLEGATNDAVAKEVGQTFTKEMASAGLKAIEAQVIAKNTSAGKQYEPGGEGGAKGPSMPKDVPGGGSIKPKVDPAKMKSEYMSDRGQDSALAEAVKASFDDYLKQFSADLLKGIEDALEQKLAGAPTQRVASASVGLRSLAASPSGVAPGSDPSSAEATGGPRFAPKTADGEPSAAVGAESAQALGGTAAGGSGAGAGGKDAAQTAAGNGGLGAANGARVDLKGSLDARLAVVEVVRRMSGGSEQIEDSASAEVVLKSTKAAEAQAASSEEVPPAYRGAVETYFRALREEKRNAKQEKRKEAR